MMLRGKEPRRTLAPLLHCGHPEQAMKIHPKTARIEELLWRAGNWTDEELQEVKRMTGRDPDDYPRSDRKKQFEIDGDWTPVREHTKALSLDDSGRKTRRASEDEAQRGLNDTWPGDPVIEAAASPVDLGPRPTAASLEERVAYVERMQELLWKAIHMLEGKKPE